MLYRSLSQLERQFGRDGKRAWYDSAAWRAYGPRYGQGTLRSLRLPWRPADQPEPITGITAPARPAARPRQPPEGVKTSRKPSVPRSEEHTSELQSLMRISYAVFCLKKKQHRSKRKHTENRVQ